MSTKLLSSDRQLWLARLKAEAHVQRARIVAEFGSGGTTPIHSIRVIEGQGGAFRHESSEGVTLWDEPDTQYLVRFEDAPGKPSYEMAIEEETALRWAFALGWDKELN